MKWSLQTERVPAGAYGLAWQFGTQQCRSCTFIPPKQSGSMPGNLIDLQAGRARRLRHCCISIG